MPGDIEEFLRRAAERRKQQGRGNKPTPPPAQVVRKPLLNEVIDAEIIEADPVSGDDVSYEVSRHLDNREFVQRTAQLGEAVRTEALNLESNIQRDFGPRPQSIDRAPISTTTRKTTDVAAVVVAQPENQVAVQLLATLGNPEAIRQAIVLSEIFNRPEHRW